MKLRKNNLRVIQKKKKFALMIELPDYSGNYLHCQEITNLSVMVICRDKLIGKEITSDGVSIVKDGTYFRLNILFKFKQIELLFHSRMLNLTDAVNERDSLVGVETIG